MNTLTVLCFDTYSKMLQALNQLQEPNLVVEVGTTHRNQQVLMYAGEVSGEVTGLAHDAFVISQPHSDVLPAYFKQKPVRAKKNVVCVECEKLSTLFSTAQTVLSTSDFECIEMNRSLSDTGLAVAIFANGTDSTVFDRIKNISAVKIDPISATFKKYF